jgi:ABC-type Na+ efflux pump permease subunit
MFERTANARIILEEEFKRQTRRIGWRIFTVGVPLVMLIIAFVVPLLIDTFSGDGDSTDDGKKIGYIDHSGVTDSLTEIPGLIRMSGLDVGTQSLVDEKIEALFVIPADYVETGKVDWYRKGSGLTSDDTTSDGFENVLRAAVADDGLSDEQVARVLQPATYTLFKVDDQGRPDSSGTK